MARSMGPRWNGYVDAVAVRSGTGDIFSKKKAAGLQVDSNDSYQLKHSANGTLRTLVNLDQAQTLSNKTLTAPAISAPTMSDLVLISGSDITYDSKPAAATITGFSWSVAAAGQYMLEADLFTTMTTTGGLTVTFKLTTATLTAIRYYSYASTATDNATAVSTQGNTTTDATAIFDSKTAAYTLVRIRAGIVVNAAGTFALQGTQNTSGTGADVTKILIGSYARLTRSV